MITHLSGTIVEATPSLVVIDVQGVGYEVLIPASSFDKLPAPGNKAHLYTHLAIRDDAHLLYGFATSEERELFRLLIQSVSGIGPKIALNVLTGLSPGDFATAVVEGDTKRLSSVSGLGKKTAERIIVELKDKIKTATPWPTSASSQAAEPGDSLRQDAIAALVALGYKVPDATKRVEGAKKMLGDKVELDHLVKASLAAGQ